MSALEARHSNAQLRRLQTLLLLMILWDALALMAEFSFGGALMKVDGGKIGGLLGGRTSLSGAALVTISAYVYGLVRNPLRHAGVIWVGIVAQAGAVFFALYHLAFEDITAEAAILPGVVAAVLLVLLVINLPRGEARAQ